MNTHSATDPDHPTLGATEPEGLERILELLARQHGLRSRGYKRGALGRRVERRMRLAGFSALPAYSTYLEHHPEALGVLHRDVLVGATRFFRDRAQWEHLARAVVPGLVRAHRDQRRPIRVWSAGCATGEEAYGLAMVLLEQLERWGSQAELQVFASDVDPQAVAIARRGVYPRHIDRDVSPRRLASFFVEQEETYQIAPQVRDVVTVSRHDLLSDPPYAWLDLVACRNVLVYLQPHARAECLRRFHFALLSRGVLWLGNAESIDPHSDSFQAITPGRRMYRRLGTTQRAKRPWSARTPTLDAYLTPPAVQVGRALDDAASATQARQVGYEQLAALNEELASANEALETAEAEAQALSEELVTLNRELEARNDRLRAVNEELELAAARSEQVRRRAESASHASRLELEREQRHKHELVATLSHELRNPLAALTHGVTLLQHGVDDPARLGMLVPLLARQTTRMTEVLDQLLDLSRMIPDDQEHASEPEPDPS